MRDVTDWTDRKYRDHGHVAHLVPFGNDRSLCGLVSDDYGDVLFGTGNFDEIEFARELPTCIDCDTATQPKTHDTGSWDDLLPELIP